MPLGNGMQSGRFAVKDATNRAFKIAICCGILTVAGCVAYPAPRGEVYGPPPHAPAPGYHQVYRGHDLRFDANLGVYVVVDLPNHYFFNDRYYRFHRGYWYYSRDLNGKWRHYKGRKLPPGLAKKYGYEEHGQHRRRYDR